MPQPQDDAGDPPMAFDVYVGPLTRYYSGTWENLGQQFARSEGLPYQLLRPGDELSATRPRPEQVMIALQDWREALTDALGDHLEEPLDWREAPDLPYVTHRPHWQGYSALLLLAAYEDNPHFSPPTRIPDDWREDHALAASRNEGIGDSDYPSILLPELWLPCNFEFLFKCIDLAGHDIYMASVYSLRAQLGLLNDRTYRMTASERGEAAAATPDEGAAFNESARFGLALFMELADEAGETCMPMKLDY